MCEGKASATLSRRTDEGRPAASVEEDGKFGETAQSRGYQVTVRSNSKTGAGTGATGSKTGVWSNVFDSACSHETDFWRQIRCLSGWWKLAVYVGLQTR